MKKTTCHLLLLVTLSLSAQAQITLTGTVKSDVNEPLIGASVLIKNTSLGTTVDVNGTFTLQLDEH
ncbi:MAG TPA: carboxypeptidase-like regulatory domain-containing protein, partial [Cyclobacteriaceae bacterium]